MKEELDCILRIGDVEWFDRLFYSLAGSLQAQKIELEMGAQALGEVAQVRLQPGEEVFAHGKQNPVMVIVEQGHELIEELFFAGSVSRLDGQDLFELVEDDQCALASGLAGGFGILLAIGSHVVDQSARLYCPGSQL